MLKKITFFTLAVMLLAVSAAFAQGRANVTGRVMDADSGRSREHALVSVSVPRATVVTDAAGHFAIEADIGEIIRFCRRGYKPATYAVSKDGQYDIGDVVLEKEGRANVGNRSAPAEKCADEGIAIITGRVIDAAGGKPHEHAYVSVSEPRATIITDIAGRFAIAANVGETVEVYSFGYETATYAVSKEGDYDIGDVELKKESAITEERTEVEIIADPAWDDDPAPSEVLHIVITNTFVAGRVVAFGGGQPVAGAVVAVGETEHKAVADSAGYFVIEAEAGDTLNFTFPERTPAWHVISKEVHHNIGNIVLKKKNE